MKLRSALFAAAVIFTTSMDDPLAAARSTDTVENFKLLDESGLMHELYYDTSAKFVVLIAHSTSCSTEFDEIVASIPPAVLAGLDFRVFGINSDVRINRTSIEQPSDLSEGDVPALRPHRGRGVVPILLDEAQIIGPALGFVNGGDHLVVRTADWRVLFRSSDRNESRTLNTTLIQLLSGNKQITRDENTGVSTRRPCVLNAAVTWCGTVNRVCARDRAPVSREMCAMSPGRWNRSICNGQLEGRLRVCADDQGGCENPADAALARGPTVWCVFE